MDFKHLASKIGLDDEDFMELVELFITTTLSDLEKIKQGVAANRIEDVVASSHSIKGAAGNMGFDDIFTLTKKMESESKAGSLENFDAYILDLENQVMEITTN
ncbi:MAG: Hpt domain-containing protein [Desulfobacteraceae bacterium]|nr:Hpt domain-containing protein [Desulfobacteraceae bacterium]